MSLNQRVLRSGRAHGGPTERDAALTEPAPAPKGKLPAARRSPRGIKETIDSPSEPPEPALSPPKKRKRVAPPKADDNWAPSSKRVRRDKKDGSKGTIKAVAKRPALPIAYFLVFAHDEELFLALIGERRCYANDLSSRYHLTHLSLEGDAEHARLHGDVELAHRFLYVLAGQREDVQGAVADVARVIHALTGHRLDATLDARCVIEQVNSRDVMSGIYGAFKALPVGFVSRGSPPAAIRHEPEAGPSTLVRRNTDDDASSVQRQSLTMLDVSNSYAYPLPHPSVSRLLGGHGGATLEELVAVAKLSHVALFDDPPSILLRGSVNSICHGVELLRSVIRMQTCFMPAHFDMRCFERVDPLSATPPSTLPSPRLADSSSDSGRSHSSSWVRETSLTSVWSAGSPKR